MPSQPTHHRRGSTPRGRAAVLALMVLVTLVLGSLVGQSALGDPA
jgi:hypothetical protein